MKIREKQGKITSMLNEQVTATPGEETDRDTLVQNDHTMELMEGALKELNPEQQQCVTLFYLQKKSYQQVSEATGFNMLQVKSYIQNGKRNLRILIEKKLEEESKQRPNARQL
jgi:RNA polymerase sigma-70 factor (ECF subfamily)